MSPPLELEDAQARLLALLAPTDPETVPVNEGHGRILAEPVIARRSQPLCRCRRP